ncbi:MAG: hypothetical protein WC905_04470 [Patescibacteria group bacterium]|jgi:hypothetical protein
MAKDFPPLAKSRAVLLAEIFYFCGTALVVFIGLEIIWPNIILVYFNLNILLIFWLASGLLLLFKK